MLFFVINFIWLTIILFYSKLKIVFKKRLDGLTVLEQVRVGSRKIRSFEILKMHLKASFNAYRNKKIDHHHHNTTILIIYMHSYVFHKKNASPN